ncbi:hypothetical protein CkaCkLH20_06911 [Colletotrichum karsti]|uniref:Uncharacterized protein n=1 Tax=Colletotrichum karsti TaxID=1095194 RepID=A0A9P6IBD6_9PEZI|nr:uncharacterized protein CkaCkLH20_06911 [Colletotrichum karsti]KAF9875530.1 hypothetical protein CkaCkLH20_06911 [Colletotrichum karsti]
MTFSMFVTNMDHFNSTVLNGNLVSTRRGLQVSKTKHQGIQFINTSAASDDTSSQDEPGNPDNTRPPGQRFKFSNKPKEPRRSVSRRSKGSQSSQDDEKHRERKGRATKRTQEPVFVWESPKQDSARDDVFQVPRFDEVSRIPRSPNSWLCPWMGNLSENEKRLVHLYLKFAPTKMYPFEQILEYNPVRSSSFIERIKSSETSLSCIIMTACYAEIFLHGEWTSPELLYHVSKVCSLVNDRLSDHTMTDVKGAAHLGLMPYLDYPRFFEAPTDALPYQIRTKIVEDVSITLSPCGLESCIIDAIVSTSLFAAVLRLAFANPGRELLLHPDGFIEEWLWCEYQLVRYPGPLRSDCVNATLDEVDELIIAADLGSSEAVAAAMVRSLHTMRPVPAPAANLLEPVLRAAAIVYLEILVPDEPRNPMVHAVPLNLLSASVHNVVQKLQKREAREGRLWGGDDKDEGDDDLPSMEALRPVMIWACLVGSVISKLCEMDLVLMGIVFDRGYYGQCLSLVIGPEPEHVDLLHDEDLALCKVLDVRGLRIKQQDERALLKALLREHVYGVPLLDLAYV